MLGAARIAVVVPAHDEERLVGRTLRGVPAWVDAIYAVDDGSTDGTARAITRVPDNRIRCLSHSSNRGVGAAIVTGYRRAFADHAAVAAVMAADDQMDPADLRAVVEPVARGLADYVKGNRFAHPRRRDMPPARRVAGHVLSALTRAATGLRIDDSQCGYTALSARAAEVLPLEDLWPGYGYPNDLLARIAGGGLRVTEVPVRPVYAGETSGVRARHFFVAAALLARHVARRARQGVHSSVPAAGGSGRGSAS